MSVNEFDELYQEILKLKNIEEARLFFADLCTITELESHLQRIKAAKMLLEGKTFVEVQEATKISSTTLARVSKCIKYGEGGYKKILTRESKSK